MLKNYIYNVSYQILAIIVPFITTPYVSRVLGATGVGRYTLSQTIAEYFTLVGMLGIALYGSREVAYVRDSRKKTSVTFWEINVMRVFTMGITCVLYVLFVFFYSEYKMLYYIQILILASNFVDISWFYQGLENFKIVAIRNILIKLIGTVLIFLFVKKKDDIILYAFIVSGTSFIGNILMWIGVRKYIDYVVPTVKGTIYHLKSAFKLWIPTMAISIYTYLDKVMLGALSTESQLGYYESAQKIVKIITTITTSLSTVMLPRISNLFIHNYTDKIYKNTNVALSLLSYIGFALMFGIMSIRNTFVTWFFGADFYKVADLLFVSSFLIITLSWSSVFGKQLLIGCNRAKEYTISVTIGAIMNVFLNFLLIGQFQSLGVTIASVAAEYTGMLIMMYVCREWIHFKSLVKDVCKYSILGLAMYLIVFNIGYFFENLIVASLVQIFIGIMVYVGLSYILNDKNCKYILGAISKMFKKR